jgi:hypothetical protein
MARIATRPTSNQYQRWFEVGRRDQLGQTTRNIFRVTDAKPKGLTLVYSMDVLQKNGQAFMVRPALEIHSLGRPLSKGQGSHAYCDHTGRNVPWGVATPQHQHCYTTSFEGIAQIIHNSWEQSADPQRFWETLEDYFAMFAGGTFTRQMGILEPIKPPVKPPKSREELEQELAALLEQGFD